MKRTARFFLVGSALLALVVGCTLIPVTVQGRLDKFLNDLNLGQYDARADTYMNFSPDCTLYDDIQGYYPATTDYYWDTYFPQTLPASEYSLSSIDSVDPSNVTAIFTVFPDGSLWGPRDVTFVMTQDGFGNYLIRELWLDISGVPTQIIY